MFQLSGVGTTRDNPTRQASPTSPIYSQSCTADIPIHSPGGADRLRHQSLGRMTPRKELLP